ncbi:phage tail protein [Ponticoccus alexandrii]|uniref:Phage tail tape measure protein n=1 Tax=Ponticoccus alexandrii TaxID=1943633 RepID=A0ABX7FA05_9RHOB|nr:hypothetical protein [Ponticoccus alexandrii]ETA53986.1 hypothetical protein P279_00370 [Rhodobacteraceae bacterium PD-2]QRF66384.1 hypothetical protein GQA70_08715 [Ponticoccus alexandrii]
MKAIVGALRVVLGMNSAAFDKGADAAEKRAKRLRKSMENIGKGMQRVGAKMSLVAAPMVGAAGMALRSSLATVDAQSKLAQSLDTSTKSIQVMARAADRAGVSTGELEQIARQLTKRLSQAATGAGPAADALKQIGLSVEELTEMNLDERIASINAAIEEHVPAAQRAAVAAKLFGDRAGLVASRIDAATIEAARKEIEKFGLDVSEIEADRIEEANDAISALGLVSRGLGNQLAVALAPVLKSMAESIANVAARFSKLSPRVQKIVVGVGALVAVIGPLVAGLGTMLILLAPVAGVFAAMSAPVLAVVVILAALAGAAAYVATNWDGIKRDYPEVAAGLSAVGRAAKDVGTRMLEAVKALGTSGLQTFRDAVGLYRALVDGDWTAVWDRAKGILSAVFESMIATLDLFTAGGASALRDAVTGIIAAVREKAPDLRAVGREIPGWIAAGVRVLIHRIPDELRQLGAKIVELIREQGAKVIAEAKQLGIDMIEGLRAGINEKIESVKQTITESLSGIMDSARDFLGIRSPSRVFARIGQFLMQGLQVGIGAGTAGAVASMTDAAGQITAAVANGMDVGDAMQGLKGEIAGVGGAAGNMFGTLGGWMADIIKRTATLGDKFRELGRTIAGSLRQSGINGLGGAIGRAFGGGVGSFATSLLGGLMPFANGGSFKVGGAGGIDSQVVAFKASPDETVTVTRPDQMAGRVGMGPLRVMVETSEDLIARAEMAGGAQADVIYTTRRRSEMQHQKRSGSW